MYRSPRLKFNPRASRIVAVALVLLGSAVAYVGGAPAASATTRWALYSNVLMGIYGNNYGCMGTVNNAVSGQAQFNHCNGRNNQKWYIWTSPITDPAGYKGYQLRDLDGKCLGVSGASKANGAKVVVATCTNPYVDFSQLWVPWQTVSDSPTPLYSWTNGKSGLFLVTINTTYGSLIYQYDLDKVPYPYDYTFATIDGSQPQV